MKKTPPLVVIVWEDICILDDETWVAHQSSKKTKPMLFRTVGFLLHDSPERVVITACWGEKLMGPREQIPRGCIRSMTTLCEP